MEHVSGPLETGDSHVLNAWSRGLLPCGLGFPLPSLYGPSVWRLTELFLVSLPLLARSLWRLYFSFAVSSSVEVGTGDACPSTFRISCWRCAAGRINDISGTSEFSNSSSEGKNLIHLLASYSELFIPRLFSIQDICFKPPRERESLSVYIVA